MNDLFENGYVMIPNLLNLDEVRQTSETIKKFAQIEKKIE